jgi:hypothetical protein
MRTRRQPRSCRSGCSLGLVDQATQPIALTHGTAEVASRSRGLPRLRGMERCRRRFRHSRPDPLMRAVTVVMAAVASEDTFQVSLVHDQEVVEALGADRLHEPLCMGVGIGRPVGRLEDLGACGCLKPGRAGHATIRYSWISTPRRSARCSRVGSMSAKAVCVFSSECGQRWPSERCGRWSL